MVTVQIIKAETTLWSRDEVKEVSTRPHVDPKRRACGWDASNAALIRIRSAAEGSGEVPTGAQVEANRLWREAGTWHHHSHMCMLSLTITVIGAVSI